MLMQAGHVYYGCHNQIKQYVRIMCQAVPVYSCSKVNNLLSLLLIIIFDMFCSVICNCNIASVIVITNYVTYILVFRHQYIRLI